MVVGERGRYELSWVSAGWKMSMLKSGAGWRSGAWGTWYPVEGLVLVRGGGVKTGNLGVVRDWSWWNTSMLNGSLRQVPVEPKVSNKMFFSLFLTNENKLLLLSVAGLLVVSRFRGTP